jgi:hypothetical protein
MTRFDANYYSLYPKIGFYGVGLIERIYICCNLQNFGSHEKLERNS